MVLAVIFPCPLVSHRLPVQPPTTYKLLSELGVVRENQVTLGDMNQVTLGDMNPFSKGLIELQNAPPRESQAEVLGYHSAQIPFFFPPL